MRFVAGAGERAPLAAAIVAGARAYSLALEPALEFESVTGKAVVGTVAVRRVLLGNSLLLDGAGVDASPPAERAESR